MLPPELSVKVAKGENSGCVVCQRVRNPVQQSNDLILVTVQSSSNTHHKNSISSFSSVGLDPLTLCNRVMFLSINDVQHVLD